MLFVTLIAILEQNNNLQIIYKKNHDRNLSGISIKLLLPDEPVETDES